jgi:hypothetical protein
MHAIFKRFVDERFSWLIEWAGVSGRAWAAETLVGEFGEYSVRIRGSLSALGEAEEAQSGTGGLLRRCVAAMTRSDKGNGCILLC